MCPAVIAHPALTLQRHYMKLVAGSAPYQRLWAAEDMALPEDLCEHRGGAPVMQSSVQHCCQRQRLFGRSR